MQMLEEYLSKAPKDERLPEDKPLHKKRMYNLTKENSSKEELIIDLHQMTNIVVKLQVIVNIPTEFHP